MSRASTPAKSTAPVKPTTPAPAAKPMPIPSEKIAMRAYEKWCHRGQPEGTCVQNWLEAEKELMTECSKSTKK
ncbi:MAG: DUF2934 domain-containing protein [Planctomycetota bacterium]